MNALEILLSKRWIVKSREKELYYQVKDQLGEYRNFLNEKLGYHIVITPNLIKLEKVPAQPENWMGILEFKEKTEYIFLCLVLMFLEDKEAEEQFVLSDLTEYVQGQWREDEIDWTVYRNRRCFVKVLKFCVNCGMLKVDDGNEENFSRIMKQKCYMKIREYPGILCVILQWIYQALQVPRILGIKSGLGWMRTEGLSAGRGFTANCLWLWGFIKQKIQKKIFFI